MFRALRELASNYRNALDTYLKQKFASRADFYGNHSRSFNETDGSVFDVEMFYWCRQYNVWPEFDRRSSDEDLTHGRHSKRPREVRNGKD